MAKTNGNESQEQLHENTDEVKAAARAEKRAAKQRDFDAAVEIMRANKKLWTALQSTREQLSRIEVLPERKVVTTAIVKILRDASRPNKEEKLKRQLERIDERRKKLIAELKNN